jgi:hypothetical protein
VILNYISPMPKPKTALDNNLPRRPLWTEGERRVHSYLDRLEALEQCVARLEQALDISIRRMGAIQAELDAMLAKRRES